MFVWRGRSVTKIRGNGAEMERRWSYADSGSLVVRRWELWAQTRGSNERGERLADRSVSQLLAMAKMTDSGRHTYESSCRRRRRVLRGFGA